MRSLPSQRFQEVRTLGLGFKNILFQMGSFPHRGSCLCFL
jgi:hypothetical protein